MQRRPLKATPGVDYVSRVLPAEEEQLIDIFGHFEEVEQSGGLRRLAQAPILSRNNGAIAVL